MNQYDPSELRAHPLAGRRSLLSADEIIVDPDSKPAATEAAAAIAEAAKNIRAARERGAAVILMYGAHLLRNGAAKIITELMERGWITHIATNGAGTIHDWEFAWLGRSCESVEDNVAAGTFGAWEETGRNIHLALLAGGLHGEGYGSALGRFIHEDGCTFPSAGELRDALNHADADAPAQAELLAAMQRHAIAAGRHEVFHKWKHASILAQVLPNPITI